MTDQEVVSEPSKGRPVQVGPVIQSDTASHCRFIVTVTHLGFELITLWLSVHIIYFDEHASWTVN
jgi:hypothetical protein